MKTCGACQHFRPYRDPDTGRVHTAKPGACGYPKPVLSMAQVRFGIFIGSVPVWRNLDAETCKTYQEKEKE